MFWRNLQTLIEGRIEIAKLLLERKVNVDAAIEKGDMAGMTPLILTATKGHSELTDLLLEHGANPNAEVVGM